MMNWLTTMLCGQAKRTIEKFGRSFEKILEEKWKGRRTKSGATRRHLTHDLPNV